MLSFITTASAVRLLNIATVCLLGQSTYTVHDLGTLGGLVSISAGINRSGQTAGTSQNASGLTHAFRTGPNAPINALLDDLGTLGGSFSQAVRINTLGQVVGVSTTSMGRSHGFRTEPNAAINPGLDDVGTLNSSIDSSFALGIDDTGRVVGESIAQDRHEHGFRTAPNAALNAATDDLGTFGGTDSSAGVINAAGAIAGWYAPVAPLGSEYPRGFLLQNGSFTDLGATGVGGIGGMNQKAQIAITFGQVASLWDKGAVIAIAVEPSEALGINVSGQVVGWMTVGMQRHAFLYSEGLTSDVNTLLPPNSGWVITSAQDINDDGQIAATGIINGQTHAVRLDPVPLPGVLISRLIAEVNSLVPGNSSAALTGVLTQALEAWKRDHSDTAIKLLQAFETVANQLADSISAQLVHAAQAIVNMLEL